MWSGFTMDQSLKTNKNPPKTSKNHSYGRDGYHIMNTIESIHITMDFPYKLRFKINQYQSPNLAWNSRINPYHQMIKSHGFPPQLWKRWFGKSMDLVMTEPISITKSWLNDCQTLRAAMKNGGKSM